VVELNEPGIPLAETAPNIALEPTASSFGFAYAFGGGSPPAFGCHNIKVWYTGVVFFVPTR
jgi:hypothetical protein